MHEPFLDDVLWPAFQELNKVPVDDLSEITDRIIRREVFLARVEAEEVDATPEHAPERGVLAGRVERVTFHNEGTGFRVPRVEARGHRDVVTVVGQAAAGAGEVIQAGGEWVNNRGDGPRFRARFLRVASPSTAEGTDSLMRTYREGRHAPIIRRRRNAPLDRP